MSDVNPDNDVAQVAGLSTKKEVAEFCSCCPRQIDMLRASGKFPSPIWVGTHPRWRRSDLLAWLDAQSSDKKQVLQRD